MTSLTAKVHPASRSARPMLAVVGAALRQLDHQSVSAGATMMQWPGLGTVTMTERPGELEIDCSGIRDTTPAAAREAISQQIRHAAGSRSAAAKLVITWAETPADRAAALDRPET